jgi:outer membrane protein TolC
MLPAEETYVTTHPTVAAMQRDVDVARQTASLTASNRKPNWTWEVAYSQRTGYSDMVSAGVSIPLAIAPGERQDRDTAAKLALVEKAEADLAEAIRAATAEYRSLHGDAIRLVQRIDGYRSAVVAPASQRTTAAMAAFRSNQGSLVVVFEARRADVEAQRKLLTLQRDLARTQVQLAFRPLTAEVSP